MPYISFSPLGERADEHKFADDQESAPERAAWAQEIVSTGGANFLENVRMEQQPEQDVDGGDAGHTTAAHVSSSSTSSSSKDNRLLFVEAVAATQRLQQEKRYLQRQAVLYSEAMRYRKAHQQLRDEVAALKQQLHGK